MERNENWICTIQRIPIVRTNQDIPFVTIPLGVMVSGDYIVTVCHYANFLVSDFIDHTQKRNINISTTPDFILRLLKSAAYWYLRYLKEMKKQAADAESGLQQSISE